MSASFSWDEHIRATNQRPAPASYFRQSSDIPANTFEKGMKLEARDPRNPNGFCLATVIDKYSARILLRLDGNDKCNDFWRLVDDQDSIAPLGSNYMLVAPVGCQRSESRQRQLLEEVRGNKSIHAPTSCFHPAPPKLSKNEFQVGMVLEAVDRKSPRCIAPAIVTDISRDPGSITIQFLGWKDVGMYSCTFNAREIFPVGWCEKADHYMEPPGPHYSPSAVTPASSRTSLSLRNAPVVQTDSPTRRERHADRLQISPSASSTASSSKRERSTRRRDRDADSDDETARVDGGNISPKSARLSEVHAAADTDGDPKTRGKLDGKKAEQAKKVEKKAESVRSEKAKERVWPPDDQVEAILGANMVDGELQFLFKWQRDDVAEMVPSSVANRRYPLHVIKFYEDRLVWCRPESDEAVGHGHSHANNSHAASATAN